MDSIGASAGPKASSVAQARASCGWMKPWVSACHRL